MAIVILSAVMYESGSSMPNSDPTPQANYKSVPTNPIYLVGATNTVVNSNTANVPAKPKPIPSEGAWLGMEIEQLSPGTIRELNLPADQTGVMVDSVPRGSAVEKAGLKNGDIIVGINGQSIVNMADYIRASNNQKSKSANIRIDRNGQQLFISVGDNADNLANRQANPGQFNGVNPPPITINAVLSHGYRGVCANCHQIVASVRPGPQGFGTQVGQNNGQSSSGLPSPAQQDAAGKVLVEGHWLGMELIPLTPELAREYNLPAGMDGLLVDEVTLVAAESGLLAGDVLQSIDSHPIKSLEDFDKVTKLIEESPEAILGVMRDGKRQFIRLRSNWRKLGIAQNEAAQPIQPGAIRPHKIMEKPCTACHIIMETGGQLALDAGDILPTPPPIRSFAKPLHSFRGVCNTCHVIIN